MTYKGETREKGVKRQVIFGIMVCWDELSHIDKLKMVCTLYKLLKTFFQLPYGFEILYISLVYEVFAPRVFPLMADIHNKSNLI